MAKILIIEDDTQLAALIQRWLTREGHTVEHESDGAAAMQRLRFDQYDLIVLDWELPGLAGIEILKNFRELGGIIPVIMLTGKKAIEDKLSGLYQGADDYLTKPFDGRELTARIASLLRRPVNFACTSLKVGEIEIDTRTHSSSRGGRPLNLLPKEFALLEFFMRHPGEYFQAQRLLEHVWPSESDSTIEALTSCIKRLRQKLDDGAENSVIRNIRGVGYGLFVE